MAPSSGKGSEKGWANLRPIKKGEVRNPKGINGYTARNAFLRRMEERLAEVREDGTTEAEHLFDVLLEAVNSYDRAERRQARDLLFDRLLPAKGLDLNVQGEVQVSVEDRTAAQARLDRLTKKAG